MRKTFSASPLPLCVLCVLGLFGCGATGQNLTGDLPAGQPAGQPTGQPTAHSNGVVQDWSTSHVVYPRIGEINSLIAVQHDPRAVLSWQAAEREDWHWIRGPRHFLATQGEVNHDWSISLGTGGMAASMYPAKYTFDVNATPTCIVGAGVPVPDFVVFTVNVATSATQPNIVGFNNLYSGTTPSPGICNRAPSGSDTGVAATTYWGYNVIAADGQVSTSPALSLDGTKVAFVETGSGTTAHFHVLAQSPFDGVNFANLQDVTKPVTIDAAFGFATLAPITGTGNASDLALVPLSGTASDSLSSPFVDYTNDVAYIGNDSGTLFRVKNVFCTLACTEGVTAAPSLDGSWGTGGVLATGCSGKLTGPVVDGGTGHIFVGCSDGKIYGFTSTGAALTNPSVTVGNGSATGGVVDPPMIDAVNHFVYGVSGASSGGTSVMVQAKTTDLSSVVTSTLGAGGSHNLHSPSFSSGYFSSANPSHWLLYEWALNSAGNGIQLYGATFSAGHVMNGGNPADNLLIGGSTPVEFSPTTEFLNGSTDQLFVSGLTSVSPNFIEYNLTNFLSLFPTSFPPGANGATAFETGGTSGIIVDNTSSSAQASSIYFGAIGSNTAVKLTQSGLN